MLIDPSLLEDDRVDELPFEFENYEDEVAFKEQLRQWHETYGSIFMTEINEVAFFFRALTRKEMEIAKEVYKDDYERTEYICKVCVIEPQIDDYSLDIFAGVPEVLCRAILEESGYTDAQKIKIMIARWEKQMEDVENQLPLVIKEAFHDIPLEEIEAWPMEKITEYYVKAKWLLENIRGLSLVSSEETQE
ncbi:tail chaperonin [Cytobacillus oceanisediminis]|uniref:tail chaperonin n=1 Tax=Cytobacillus oceanisediminis TaxID=665099 RepID=UPI001FB1CE6C|nr:tail chaperonin [Cytobacillus oceanisediminis]UOE58083.1 tail chaperonin [Cytobacillus oceanisediminis]